MLPLRRVGCALGFAAILLLGRVGAAGAEDAPKPPAPAPVPAPVEELATWDGYLWKEADGRLRLGMPLVLEQFMEGSARVVPAPLAERLGPLVSPVSESAFHFGFALARPEKDALVGVPRAFVRLRGREVRDPSADRGDGLGLEGTVRLDDARLVTVERLPEAWLRAWRAVFVDPAAPTRSRKDEAPPTVEARRRHLDTLVAAWRSMVAVPSPEADGARTTETGPIDAPPSVAWRREIETDLVREILAEAKSLGAKPPEDVAAARVPPEPWTLMEWFVEAKTLAALLARAKQAWAGAPEALRLAHYDGDDAGRSRWHVVTDLATIRDTWSEAGYARRRQATLDVRAQR